MSKLIKTVLIANILSLLIVFALYKKIEFFTGLDIGGFCFYNFLLIWLAAAFTWEGTRYTRGYNLQYNHAVNRTDATVSASDLKAVALKDQSVNYNLGFRLFIAGLPSFLIFLVFVGIN